MATSKKGSSLQKGDLKQLWVYYKVSNWHYIKSWLCQKLLVEIRLLYRDCPDIVGCDAVYTKIQ
jgi:hypothetical protein